VWGSLLYCWSPVVWFPVVGGKVSGTVGGDRGDGSSSSSRNPIGRCSVSSVTETANTPKALEVLAVVPRHIDTRFASVDRGRRKRPSKRESLSPFQSTRCLDQPAVPLFLLLESLPVGRQAFVTEKDQFPNPLRWVVKASHRKRRYRCLRRLSPFLCTLTRL